MRILVNATTITVGGGVQATVSFLEHVALAGDQGHEYLFAVSTSVMANLGPRLANDSRVHAFEESPASAFRGRRSRARLLQLESAFAPHLAYSMGFPSYVRFKCPEIGRYTNPWEICALPVAWRHLPAGERVTRWLRTRYRLHAARHARYFETQTETAKRGILRRVDVPEQQVLVLPNSANSRFVHERDRHLRSSEQSCADRLRVFCLAAEHRHKNLDLIPEVAKHLADDGKLQCTFLLTLPGHSDLWKSIRTIARKLRVNDWVRNLERLNLDQCAEQYRLADCVFLPTLAEVFSATYLEAMGMGVPIVTTDIDFAREICGGAARYFEPRSSRAAATALTSVLSDAAGREQLRANGYRRLADFPTAEEKHTSLIRWFETIYQDEYQTAEPDHDS